MRFHSNQSPLIKTFLFLSRYCLGKLRRGSFSCAFSSRNLGCSKRIRLICAYIQTRLPILPICIYHVIFSLPGIDHLIPIFLFARSALFLLFLSPLLFLSLAGISHPVICVCLFVGLVFPLPFSFLSFPFLSVLPSLSLWLIIRVETRD